MTVIVYEAGEALRFDDDSILRGAEGILSVMREIGMLPRLKQIGSKAEPLVAHSSPWVRAPQSGISNAHRLASSANAPMTCFCRLHATVRSPMR